MPSPCWKISNRGEEAANVRRQHIFRKNTQKGVSGPKTGAHGGSATEEARPVEDAAKKKTRPQTRRHKVAANTPPSNSAKAAFPSATGAAEPPALASAEEISPSALKAAALGAAPGEDGAPQPVGATTVVDAADDDVPGMVMPFWPF